MRANVRSVQRRRLTATAIAISSALLIGACSSDSGSDASDASLTSQVTSEVTPAGTSPIPQSTVADGGTAVETTQPSGGELPKDLSILVPFSPPVFDQYATIATQPLGTILLVNEPLIRYEGAEFVPELAESFETVSPTEYVYTLREGVKFSDGTPLTPEDVKFSLEEAMDETNPNSSYVFMDTITDIAIDGNTITIDLSAPEPQLVYIIAQTGIVSKAFYEANGEDVGTPGVGQIGSGPYLLDSFKPEEETVLVPNPDYWGDPAVFDSITFTAAADDSARMLALQSGDPTGIFEIPIAQVGAVDQLDEYSTYETSDATFYILQMNENKPPFDDPKVRDAVRHAVNRSTIVDAVFGGRGMVASTITSRDALLTIAEPDSVDAALASFDEQNQYDEDVARSLLAESSVPDGFSIELPVESYDPNMNLIGQTVIQDLSAIGINATLRPMGDEYFPTVMFDKDSWGLTLNSFSTSTPDPAMPMPYFIPGDGLFNVTGLANDEAAAKLQESNQLATDDPQRGVLILEALTLLQETGAVLPLAMPNMYFGLSDDLTLNGFTNYWALGRWDLRISAK